MKTTRRIIMKNKYNSNSSTQIEEIEEKKDRETVVYKKIETSASFMLFSYIFFFTYKTRMSFYNITSSTQKKKF